MEEKYAGVKLCTRCKEYNPHTYRWWQQKVRGFYIKFCNVCGYGNYLECPEAKEKMEELDNQTPDHIPLAESFEIELQNLINRHNKEFESGTPDYILAEYMLNCLESFNTAIKARNKHFQGIRTQ